MNQLTNLKAANKKAIGIWGYPDPKVLLSVRKSYPELEVIDLDVDYQSPESAVIPESYCRIMRNIIDNALFLRDNLEIIVASVGEEKCDSGRFAAKILSDMGFNIIETRYNTTGKCFDTPISQSSLPLKEKILTIMDGVVDKTDKIIIPCKPQYGFWGVPPNDLEFLDVFPETTHVYGWTRCVEAGCPADLELEMFVDENIPTVFFAQTFCAKMQLAKYLAKKHDGLYVDVDDKASNSVRAKIEAFIKLG